MCWAKLVTLKPEALERKILTTHYYDNNHKDFEMEVTSEHYSAVEVRYESE